MLLTILIVVIIFLSYFTIIVGLSKFGIFKKYNISTFGPIIMWRTKRGRKFLDKLSHARTFWRWYANIGILICIIAMVFMFFTVVIGAAIALTIKTEPLPPQNILVLPGLNPMIPIWYGIFGLAVGIIVHEFSHGILARRAKIKIKSMGLLLFIVPIGAFVEPDDKELEKLNRRERARMFAAGPTSNIIFGLLCAAIFSWIFIGSLVSAEDGILVLNVTEDFPAKEAGIEPGMMVTDLEAYDSNGSYIDFAHIETREDFSDFMSNLKSNDILNVTVYYNHKKIVFENVVLADKYNYSERDEDSGIGFLGVGTQDAEDFKESLAHPVLSAGDNVQQRRNNIFQYIFFLPMDLESKILPFHSPLTDAYEVEGPLSALPTSLFWILANVFYYLFWLNFLLGIFNMIPAIPLDGGYVFRDGMDSLMERLRPTMDEKTRIGFINLIAVSLAFFILILFLIIFMVPYLLKL